MKRSRLAALRESAREAFITIGEYGEFALIAAIQKALPGDEGLIVGIGDDAAVVRAPDSRVVATTDMLVEGRHFRREWSSPRDIGAKAAARNLADIAAMGARPTALLVSFAGPGDLEVSWVLDVATGIGDEASAAGAVVAGGDTSSANLVILALTALGDLAGTSPVTRSGARPGDLVAVTGTLGSAAAGLALLGAGLGAGDPGGAPADRTGQAPADPRTAPDPELESLIAAHRRPSPPYSAGPDAAALGATAMIDISDGLIADVGHIASASGVKVELQADAIADEPVARRQALAHAAEVLGGDADWRRWVLTGGEDHALVATFPSSLSAPGTWTVIGRVTRGHGVVVDGRRWPGAGGWEHFVT
ncbi:MAG: thiamine-phosphate kinase [Nocardiopsaceae bacterium]|nr:thiamine-phosphate kinase [Nocardiopsaceae bacterium]